MTRTIRNMTRLHTSRAHLSRHAWAEVALWAMFAGCSGEPVATETVTEKGVEPEASIAAAHGLRAAVSTCARRGLPGRTCAVGTIDCGTPAAPVHGTVRAPVTHYGAIASYACSTGYALQGSATRTCQADGAWSGTAPTCAFASAGAPCGSCGGSYDVDGTCSIPTPPDLGAVCDVGSGKGACAQAGTIACGGVCQPGEASLGDATVWHLVAAPNGSWDWDCDGAVTTTLHAVAAPADCSTYADAQSCEASTAMDYVTEDVPCGQQAVLFTRDCQWMTLGPTCLNTPASHRVTFQQCR